jgi:hypothetical protein
MNNKKCPFCNSPECIKKGFQQGHQRWQCKKCKTKFQANKKVPLIKEELFCLYVFNKQTLRELSVEHHFKTQNLQSFFDSVVLPKKKHCPRELSLAVDTTFFEEFGVVVFRDQERKENLWWKFVESERLIHYEEGMIYLERLGYTFRSVTGDGLPGLPSVFVDIQFQYCHFHARKNITKYITRNPKTNAGIELKFIMDSLKSYTHNSFLKDMSYWEEKYSYFLKEKTYHPGGNWSYTHGRLRSAIRSMKRMSGYLFTYQRCNFFMPVTTNTLEGHFAHLKVRVGVHRGISLKRKQRIIYLVLLNSSASYEKDMHKKLF